MKTKWMWTLGITLGFIALFVIPIFLRSLLTYHQYGMLGYGWYMPMMHGGDAFEGQQRGTHWSTFMLRTPVFALGRPGAVMRPATLRRDTLRGPRDCRG